jgi:hypothetical protein
MTAFLLSGMLSFIVYQCLAWAHVPRGKPSLNIGQVKVEFSASAAIWARRSLRLVIAVLILGALFLLDQPLLAPGAVAKSQVALLLGAFWGPLFAIWINAVIANAAGANLTRGQFIAGIGLALLFLIGSFGNETGSVLKQYARKINNLKFAGAEVSFSDKSKAGSPGAGAVASPGKPLVSGSAGLTYFAGLGDMIGRDENYLDLLRRLELADLTQEQSAATTDDTRRRQLNELITLNQTQWEKTRVTLETARNFANQTVTKPLNCLLGWYEVTGDAGSINGHLASYGHLFQRIQAIDTRQQVDDIADGLVRVSAQIGVDMASSVPAALIGDRCNPLIAQFCPDDLASKNRQSLLGCLQKSLDATTSGAEPVPSVENLRQATADGLQRFVDSDGIGGRPYFVSGYASILAQLGQYTAAGAVLDGWLQRRAHITSGESRWALAEDWFNIRARTMLAAYMEEWVRNFGAQPPTNVLDEHIKNLDVAREYFDLQLRRTSFFKKLADDLEKQEKFSYIKPERCKSKDPDIATWRLLFETYVTLELTRVQATLLHFDYEEKFAEETTKEATKLASMDLSCISDHVEAEVYAAQILEAFGRNAMMYTETLGQSDSDDANAARLAEAVSAARHGQALLKDAKGITDASEEKKPDPDFLTRIETSEIEATQEKLNATISSLKKAQQDLGQ